MEIKSLLHRHVEILSCVQKGTAIMSQTDTVVKHSVHPAKQLANDLHKQPGSLIVICGSMCSGKTEELIRIVGRLIRSGKARIQTFKPAIDNRILHALHDIDPTKHITSRTGSFIECIATDNLERIREYVYAHDIEIIAFDESHFFEKTAFLNLVNELLNEGRKIIVGGLDLDFRSESFGAMGDLLALADNVVKLNAICARCGTDTYCITQRLINDQPAHYNDPLIMVGDQEYEPRCRKCHVIKKN